MTWYSGMHCYSTWLTEVEEDLFFILYSQQYQSRRRRLLHWNTQHQTQWIEEKWDLTFQMIWFHGMHNHPVWLIEVEEDLFLISFFQLYQSTRMMMPNRNNSHQSQWIEEKWDLILQMIWYHRMHYNPVWLIEVEEDLFLISFTQIYQSRRMMTLHWNTSDQYQ